MKLHLHVGVHKTATTHLQRRLWQNRARLNDSGVGYMALAKFRALFTSPLASLSPHTFRIEDHLGEFFEGAVPKDIRGLILSDENLLGYCNDFVDSGRLYRRCRRRLEQVATLLCGHDVTVFMAIRSYDEFASSMYCETLRFAERFFPFADFQKRLDVETMRWPSIIDRVSKILEPACIRLWRYEDFRQHAPQLLRALAFATDLEADLDEDEPARPSFSADAVGALEAIANRLGPVLTARLINPVADALPKGGALQAFDPWDVDAKTKFQAMYAADCAALPAEYWLVSPPVANAKPSRLPGVLDKFLGRR